jgi:transposase-like protein
VILFEVLPKIFDKEYAMTATPSIELPTWMAEQLSQASPDLLRQMVQIFAEALMSADADAVCGADYFPDRTALIRLDGAVLAEQHDEWTEMRRYIGPDILAKSRLAKITDPNPTDPEVTITAITA